MVVRLFTTNSVNVSSKFSCQLLCVYLCRSDNKDYALKLIEGTGYSQSFSLSACREVAVCNLVSVLS